MKQTNEGLPTPMVIRGDADGSSQFSTARISSRPIATHPQVGLPSVTWRKIPDTRPGMRCGFTAMLTAAGTSGLTSAWPSAGLEAMRTPLMPLSGRLL